MSLSMISMSTTYNIINITVLPLAFLKTHNSYISWSNLKLLYCLIKPDVPTPRCLHQSISGPLSFANFKCKHNLCWLDYGHKGKHFIIVATMNLFMPFGYKSVLVDMETSFHILLLSKIHLYSMGLTPSNKSVKDHTWYSTMSTLRSEWPKAIH